MKKRWIVVLTLCLLSCLSGFGVTYSYLITKTSSINTLTVGEVTVKIEETFTPPKELSPDMTFQKAPYAVNTGNLPCFVRMRADYTTVNAAEFCTLTGLDEDNWVKASDGYYYYKHLLNPGSSTVSAPFSQVHIGDCDENLLENFDIAIYAEAVQHFDHTDDCAEDEYLTVWNHYHKNGG